MKRAFFFFMILLSTLFITNLLAQKKPYITTAGETIFSFGNLQFTEEYKTAHPEAEIVSQPVRFTVFFHIGQLTHFDLTNNIGLLTGFGLRNIGVITDEYLPESGETKIIRRAYSMGIPLGIKLGSFDDNFFLYGGGEYEWAFHVKEKYWNSYNRNGHKNKNTQWFSNKVNTFLPSVFVGIQFPKGYNIKFKYYLTDFLNSNYSSSKEISDLSRYKQSKLMYISFTMQIKPKDLIKKKTSDEVALY